MPTLMPELFKLAIVSSSRFLDSKTHSPIATSFNEYATSWYFMGSYIRIDSIAPAHHSALHLQRSFYSATYQNQRLAIITHLKSILRLLRKRLKLVRFGSHKFNQLVSINGIYTDLFLELQQFI